MIMNIEYTVHIWREGDQFIAHAMPLDVMSSGRTTEEARTALYEAVDLFLETVEETRTLEELLQEAGYEFKRESWISPVWIAVERHSTLVGV